MLTLSELAKQLLLVAIPFYRTILKLKCRQTGILVVSRSWKSMKWKLLGNEYLVFPICSRMEATQKFSLFCPRFLYFRHWLWVLQGLLNSLKAHDNCTSWWKNIGTFFWSDLWSSADQVQAIIMLCFHFSFQQFCLYVEVLDQRLVVSYKFPRWQRQIRKYQHSLVHFTQPSLESALHMDRLHMKLLS